MTMWEWMTVASVVVACWAVGAVAVMVACRVVPQR
jgi:hypothetical protein